jgi:hypothetical protein
MELLDLPWKCPINCPVLKQLHLGCVGFIAQALFIAPSDCRKPMYTVGVPVMDILFYENFDYDMMASDI